MKKLKILTTPTRFSDLSFDDMYDEASDNREMREEKLRTQALRKFKHQSA